MRPCAAATCGVALAVGLVGSAARAAEFRHLDGIHRIEKQRPQVTAPPALHRREGSGSDSDADEGVCGASLKSCAKSLDGGCCPNNYECARESCYATTRGPSTCGGRVAWHPCDPVYGGGCCPDGYACETADACVPPSGSSYTYACPTGKYLCPSSLSYGCCPDGMGCAINQCYSTEASTIITTMVITTTEDGSRTTITSKSTTVQTPDVPTQDVSGGSDGDSDQDQAVLKFFPSVMAKIYPSETSDSDSDDGGGGGLSKAALIGIVVGAAVFLLVALVAAWYLLFKKKDKRGSQPPAWEQTESSTSHPNMKMKPSPHDVDNFSVDPLMMATPEPSYAQHERTPDLPFGQASPDFSSADGTPITSASGYQPVAGGSAGNSRHASLDPQGNVIGYFDSLPPGKHARYSQQSSTTPASHRMSNDSQGTYAHFRHYSNASEASSDNEGVPLNTSTPMVELEASRQLSELPAQSTPGSPREDRRWSSGSGTGAMSRPPLAHQRKRSDGWPYIDSTTTPTALDVVNEEMIHGFHGPADHLVGQTNVRPPTQGSNQSGKKDTGPGGQTEGDVREEQGQ